LTHIKAKNTSVYESWGIEKLLLRKRVERIDIMFDFGVWFE